MTQHQSNKFHMPFYFRFGSSNLFSPAKPEFWPAFWPLAGRYFEPCIVKNFQGGNSAPENELRPLIHWYTWRSIAPGACPWSKTPHVYRPLKWYYDQIFTP